MKAAKILLGVLVGLVALLGIGAALIAYRFDPNDYKGYATDMFESRTGRSLAIEQDLQLSYFPWLAIEAGGITIGNAPGFGERPFATVERAAARVKLLPLLRREIEIGIVELDGLQLDLARNAELVGNWQDLLDTARGDAAADPTPSDPDPPGAVQRLELEGVRIRRGNVAWRENTTELRYTVGDLTLATGPIGGGGPVDLDLDLQFRDEVSALTVALTASTVAELGENGAIAARNLTADFTVEDPSHAAPLGGSVRFTRAAFDQAAQTIAVEGLIARVAGIESAIELRGTQVIDNPTLEGTIATREAPLAALLDLLGTQVPNGVDAQALGNFAAAAAFRYRHEPREIVLSNVDARLLGMTVGGSATLDASDTLRGNLAIPEFKPNDSFYAFVRPAAADDVDLTAIDRLALSMSFDANLASGRASLRDIRASALGASITASLDMTPGSAGTGFRGSFATSRFAPDAAAKIFRNMLPDGIQVGQLGMIALDTRFSYDPGQDLATVAPFRAEAFGLSASGELNGNNLSWAPIWSGRAQIAQFSPQELITRFGLPPQPTSDPRALTRASVDARFTVDGNQGKLDDLVLALDDSRITGDFTIEDFQNPKYLFTLAIDGVDADRYLPPSARDAEEGEATAGDLKLPENNTMRMDGRMQIGTLKLAGMSFQDVGSRIVLGDGNATLESARARLYGGEFNGNFRVKAAGAAPGLALDGRATGLQLQPLIEALTGEAANFSGTGSFDLNLAGNGRTVIENVQTAAGDVRFEMVDGAIKGFNLGRTLCAAYNLMQRAPSPPELPAQTEYRAIQGTSKVTAGTAQSSDLLARTAFMDINGAGSLELVNQRLSYDLDAKLTSKIDIPNCETLDRHVGGSIPFNIRGTVTSPTITPDFSKLVQRAIREEVQERLQERLQDRLRDILR